MYASEQITMVGHWTIIDQLAQRLPNYLLNQSRMADHFPLQSLIYSNRTVTYSDRAIKLKGVPKSQK